MPDSTTVSRPDNVVVASCSNELPVRHQPDVRLTPNVIRATYAGRVTNAAAFFDLDKTVIAKSSTLAFSRPFFRNGLINRRAVLKGAYAQFVFAASGADADQVERMRSHLTALCTGWDVQQVRAVVDETLHD